MSTNDRCPDPDVARFLDGQTRIVRDLQGVAYRAITCSGVPHDARDDLVADTILALCLRIRSSAADSSRAIRNLKAFGAGTARKLALRWLTRRNVATGAIPLIEMNELSRLTQLTAPELIDAGRTCR